MPSAPLVSIIIPTYHDWARLSECIKALELQTYPFDRFEVIIVNNDPQDPIQDTYYIPANFKIINEAKPSSYAARNAGLCVAKGEIIGFTDSDCIPLPTWIEAAVACFESNPQIDRVGGKVELFISGNKHTLAEAYETVYAFRQEENIKTGMSVTANMFAKKKVFDQIGHFNASMFSGGDFEWGIRATANNFQIVFSADVVVKHPARNNLKQLLNKIKRVASGKLYIDPDNRNSIVKLLYFVYEFRPPINEFRHINSRGKQLSFKLKILVFFLRYHIRILRAYEGIKLYNGAKPFTDNAIA